jgi:hypothetical protein
MTHFDAKVKQLKHNLDKYKKKGSNIFMVLGFKSNSYTF